MKRHLAIVTLVILALAVPASMLAQQNSKAEKEIRATIEEMRQAIIKGGSENIAMLEKYSPDDWVRINGSGVLVSKAELINGLRAGAQKAEVCDYSDIKVNIYGKWAIVTGIENGKGTYLGTPYTGVYRWSRVFMKQNGIWKLVLYQHTPIARAAKQ